MANLLPIQLSNQIVAPSTDPVIRQIPDSQGGLTTYFTSGAMLYALPDGTWFYVDGNGIEYIGDAQGNYCDSTGRCYGAWSLSRKAVGLGIAAFFLYHLFKKR